MTTEAIKWQTARLRSGHTHIQHIGEDETVSCRFSIIETRSGCFICEAPFTLKRKRYECVEAAKQTCQDLYRALYARCEESALAHLGN